VALMARGLFAEALASFDEVVGSDPKLAVARAARASARFGLERYDDAAEDYRQALALDPALATPLYGLGECMRQRGDHAAAARYYEAYLRTPPTAPDAREDLRQVARRRLEETKR